MPIPGRALVPVPRALADSTPYDHSGPRSHPVPPAPVTKSAADPFGPISRCQNGLISSKNAYSSLTRASYSFLTPPPSSHSRLSPPSLHDIQRASSLCRARAAANHSHTLHEILSLSSTLLHAPLKLAPPPAAPSLISMDFFDG
ncbi:hypothetical protein B0H14DRAFT_3509897 [Mycena olivaceomarginata]|nr:hypothetical protein B0H14DRAFT_3509897 [Mycena olivaceomarginata]